VRRPRLLVLTPLLLILSACGGEGPSSNRDLPNSADRVADSNFVDTTVPLPEGVEFGAIQGQALLLGVAPGNRVIRMGVDPKCAEMTAGQTVVQKLVVATREGDLANVFVHLEANVPSPPPSLDPVMINQEACIYEPRVVGVRLGQTVEILNSDDLLHNLHGFSGADNGFNVGQPAAGLVHRFQAAHEEVMLHMTCDIHRWMDSYIGIVNHSYFDVTPGDGGFGIDAVPVGTYTINAWHEVYGELSQTVEVRVGETTTVDFSYTAEDQ
jgi:hypothetical protein